MSEIKEGDALLGLNIESIHKLDDSADKHEVLAEISEAYADRNNCDYTVVILSKGR